MSGPLEHLDVLVVGAGLSGIGAAVHLQRTLPGATFAVLEARERLGGTWDLFRYPAAYALVRWKNVLLTMLSYQVSRRRPALMKSLVRKGLEKQPPAGYDLDTHFTPTYDPWDRSFCIVPEGDLFRAIRRGTASVVTGHIDSFTETGIRLTDGQEVPADVVVTATGLNLLVLGGVELRVGGRTVELSETVGCKGMMFSGVPNLAASIGYTNASWTLECDLICACVCRLLAHMRTRGLDQVTPEWTGPALPDVPFIDLRSGYVLRSVGAFPRQGERAPWRVHQNYLRDRRMLGAGPRAFEGLRFSARPAVATAVRG